MIHSMSGGVLSDGSLYTFAKVETEGNARWYLSVFPVSEGEIVLCPSEGGHIEGRVLRVERCDRKSAPVPPKNAPYLMKKFENGGEDS